MISTTSVGIEAYISWAPLVAELEAWEIGVVAFLFVGVILVVSYLLEKWGIGLHA
ncbi:MAG: hypothetical protein ABEJ67_02895 [Halanaeroarchaeum sp.]